MDLPTQEATKAAREELKRQQKKKKQRRKTGKKGFDPSDLPDAPPETGPGLYHSIINGPSDHNHREINQYIAAGNLDESELEILRMKQNSLSMLAHMERRWGVTLDRPIDKIQREIEFIGQSSKGRHGFAVRSINRQEQVSHQEQMHQLNRGGTSKKGMMDKLKQWLSGGKVQLRDAQAMGGSLRDPANTGLEGGMMGGGRRGDDEWF